MSTLNAINATMPFVLVKFWGGGGGPAPSNASRLKVVTREERRKIQAELRQYRWDYRQRERARASRDRQRFASAMRITLPTLCKMRESGQLPATTKQIVAEVCRLQGSKAARKFARWGKTEGIEWDLCELRARESLVRQVSMTPLIDLCDDTDNNDDDEDDDPDDFVPYNSRSLWDFTDDGAELVDSGFVRFVRGKRTVADVLKARGRVKKATRHFTRRIKERLWHPQGALFAEKIRADMDGESEGLPVFETKTAVTCREPAPRSH